MKITLRKFSFIDYCRMLGLTLRKETSKELNKSFFGYIFYSLRHIFDKNKQYKFSILIDDKFAGSMGLYHEKDYYDLGYYVIPDFRGRGVATLAVKKLLDYAFSNLKISIIRAETEKSNIGSVKVLRKNHFKLIKKKGKDLYFEIKRLR